MSESRLLQGGRKEQGCAKMSSRKTKCGPQRAGWPTGVGVSRQLEPLRPPLSCHPPVYCPSTPHPERLLGPPFHLSRATPGQAHSSTPHGIYDPQHWAPGPVHPACLPTASAREPSPVLWVTVWGDQSSQASVPGPRLLRACSYRLWLPTCGLGLGKGGSLILADILSDHSAMRQ